MSEKWKAWWKAAGMRAIKTLAQTAVGCIGAAVALGGCQLAHGGLCGCPGGCGEPSDQCGGAPGS